MLSLAPRTKVLPHLLERATEALRRVESTKAQHWVVPLFHPAMILLDAPVEESAAAMLDFVAEHLPNRTRIRIVPIAGYLPRRSIYNRESATEEALGCRHIPRRAEHRVDQVAFSINRSVEIAPFPFDLQIRFVDVPAASSFSLYACDAGAQPTAVRTVLPTPAPFRE